MSKKKFLNFLIILLVVVILVTILLIVIKYGRNQINEKRLSDVVEEFNSKYDNENDSDTQISEDIKIDDYTVVGIITIPKIDLKYPILDRTDNKGMKLSITKFWGNELNEIGNVTFAGHNNRDGTMFGKTKYLEKGDKIKLSIRFKGRQMAHPEVGNETLNKFLEYVTDYATIEKKPVLDGRRLTCVLSSKVKK